MKKTTTRRLNDGAELSISEMINMMTDNAAERLSELKDSDPDAFNDIIDGLMNL